MATIPEPTMFPVIEKMNEELAQVQKELEDTKQKLATAMERLEKKNLEYEIVYENQDGVLYEMKTRDFTNYLLWYNDLSRAELYEDIDRQIDTAIEAEMFLAVHREGDIVYVLDTGDNPIERFIQLNEAGKIDIEEPINTHYELNE